MAKARRVPLAIRTGYDAESDLGLVPYDPDPEVAEQNAEQLNAALAAQWRGGEFQFRDGTQGPILQPITFSAKTFYFAGEIRTTRRGGHTLIGGGGRGFARGDEEFGTGVNALGGAVTRLVRIDGGPDSGPILRLKGSGMFCQNIEFYGRRTGANINRGSKTVSNATNAEPIVITTTAPHGYSTGDVINVFGVDGNSAANGEWTITVVSSTTFSLDGSVGNDDYTGDGWVADPLCQFGILLEGRESGPGGSVSTGKHVFINFGIYGCERAIGFLDGYDDGEGFVQENQHADESLWLDGRIVGCKTAVWSVNYQAVWHTFERLVVGGAGGVNPTVVLDVVRGGLWRVNDLHLGPVPLTILRVWSFKDSPNNEWSPNTARFHIHFYRDGGGNSEQVFRLFEYHAVPNGGGQYPDAEFRVWDVRFTGSIAGQNASQYDPLEFVRFHDAELNAVPCTNIWFDVYNLYTNQDFSGTPLAGYTWEQQGPWWRLVKPLP